MLGPSISGNTNQWNEAYSNGSCCSVGVVGSLDSGGVKDAIVFLPKYTEELKRGSGFLLSIYVLCADWLRSFGLLFCVQVGEAVLLWKV